MSNSNHNLFSVSDLALATVIALHQPLYSIDRSNPKRVGFLFEKSEFLESVISEYWQKKLKVEPQAYFQQLKFLKTRLYSED